MSTGEGRYECWELGTCKGAGQDCIRYLGPCGTRAGALVCARESERNPLWLFPACACCFLYGGTQVPWWHASPARTVRKLGAGGFHEAMRQKLINCSLDRLATTPGEGKTACNSTGLVDVEPG